MCLQVDHTVAVDFCVKHNLAFASPTNDSDFIIKAEIAISKRYSEILHDDIPTLISENRIIKLIKQLKMGCSPGIDQISSAHLTLHLSNMLSLCVRYGFMPESFHNWVLVPIPTKNNLEPSLAAHYRSITVSVVLSKLLKLYISEEFSDHNMDASQ